MSQKRKCVKQLMQVHQSRLPRYDRVVSSVLTSTASGGSLAMFETLSSSEEVPCCGSNRNGHITPSDSIPNSNKESIVCNNAVIFFRHTWLMWCHSLAFIVKTKWQPAEAKWLFCCLDYLLQSWRQIKSLLFSDISWYELSFKEKFFRP